MPIYAYRCADCGHAQDVLQKMSDPLLTQCPSCGAEAFVKQVTAAGFQLKGSGWYVTDFRDKGGAAAPKPAEGGAAPVVSGDKGGDKGADKSSDKTSDKPAAKPAADGAAKAPAASGGSSGDSKPAAAPPAPST